MGTVASSLPAVNKIPTRLVSLVVIINLIVAGIIWFSLQRSRAHHEELAEITAKNISHVLDENISGLIKQVDTVLQATCDEAEHQLSHGVISKDLFDSFIVRNHSRLPELIAFRATDATGSAIYGSAVKAATTTSLAHRDYFKLLRDTPDAGMVISKPLVGGISGKWIIVIARRYNNPDGTFAGLVYAGLGLEYLANSFKKLNIGPNGSITLVDEDVTLITRHPDPKSVGADFGQKIKTPQLIDLIQASKAPEKTYKARSSLDSLERIYSFRKLTRAPALYIATGMSPIDYLVNWRSEVFTLSLYFGIFSIITIVGAGLLNKEWQKNKMSEQALHVLNAELEERVKERTKSAEEANKILNSVIECMSDWVWAVDVTGCYTYCSVNVERVLGYRPDEMIGKTPFDFMEDAEAERLHIEFDHIVKNKLKIKNLENVCISKNGHRIHLSTSGVPIVDEVGKLIGYRGVDTDITEKRLAEAILVESNKRFTSTFQNAPTMMTISTLEDGRCLDVNRRFVEVTGFNKEETVGKTFTEIGLIEPSERLKIITAIQKTQCVYDLELKYHTKSGTDLLWKYSGQMIQLEGNNYLLSSAIDITENRSTERQLQQAQKLEAVGQLAGGIAHDFNNKLMVMMCNVELAQMDIDDSSKVLEYLKEIYKAAEHSRDITSRLLSFSRQQTTKPQKLNINDLISDSLKSLSRLIGEHIVITFSPDLTLWNVKFDPTQFDQIIMNMAVNARDAMPNGGEFTIETSNMTIYPQNGCSEKNILPGEYVRVLFRDTGYGMTEETLAHIFEPFFTTKDIGKGTGLGLATIYGIIGQNNGFIEVASSPGNGTAFEIYIPRYNHATEAERNENVDIITATDCCSILLVEDDDSVRRITALSLNKLGYTVYEAESPTKALEFANDSSINFDLVLTDMVMPIMNGRMLMEQIRTIRPGIACVIASGYSTIHAEMNESPTYDCEFIQKPYDLKTLAKILKRVQSKCEED